MREVQEFLKTHRNEWHPSSFLAQLDEPALNDLLSKGSLVRFAPGETLIEEGSSETDVLLLLSACVKVTARLGPTSTALLAVRFAGDVVGEFAAVDGSERLATVQACGLNPVYSARLSHESFSSVLAAFPGAERLLARTIVRKLRTATRRRIDYVGCTPLVRVARVLVELADDFGQPVFSKGITIGVDLTKVELGTLIGGAEITANRALKVLRERGLIDTHGRRMIITNLEALRSLAYGP